MYRKYSVTLRQKGHLEMSALSQVQGSLEVLVLGREAKLLVGGGAGSMLVPLMLQIDSRLVCKFSLSDNVEG